MDNNGVFSRQCEMLGKLMDNIPSKIDLPLDVAISDLKKYRKEMPFNLFTLTSRQVKYLQRMLSIINGIEVPQKLTEGKS